MNLSEIMNLIDDQQLIKLGKLYKIDKVNNKITGVFIVKSFVRCILVGKSLTLRSLEIICNKSKELSGLLKAKDPSKKQIDHSSLGKRLELINCDYFQAIYKDLVQKYNDKFTSKDSEKFHRFDSTIITLSGKLLKDGINVGGKATDRHIKISVGLKNAIPSSVRLCTTQAEVSEDVALVAAINAAKIDKEDVVLFDRGISSSATFNKLSQQDIKFVTRVKQNRRYRTLRINRIIEDKTLDKLVIISDEVVHLYDKKDKEIACELRLIKAKNSDGKELCFLTNIAYLSAQEIGEAYKRRWDIEVLFKFIKQNLQIKHFLSHNSNGMMVYIYCILIAAILFAIFKLLNKLTGFKLALLAFTLELEKAVIKDIVIFSGGNPDLVDLRL